MNPPLMLSIHLNSPHLYRSPDSIAADIRAAFAESPYSEIRLSVDCEVKGGDVRILGTVSSYFLKQMAQETVSTINGVRELDNQIQVDETIRRRERINRKPR